jgi:hypothetical protein
MAGEANYPYLSTCKVEMLSSTVGTKPPVKLPRDFMDALSQVSIPPPYDFALERAVMAKKKERDAEQQLTKASSRDELLQAVIVKMKAVTNADEDVCVALLEDFGYDLKQSVEAFFQTSMP